MFVGKRTRRRLAMTVVAAAGVAGAALPASALAVNQTNACKNSATANNSQINLDTSGTAPATAAPGDSVVLSNIQQSGAIPGAIFVAGYNLGLLQTGNNNIPTAVYSVINGSNTVEGNKQTNTVNTTISTTITDPDGNPGTGDETATDATFTVNYNNLTYTAGPSGVISFAQAAIAPPSAGNKVGSFIAVASLAGGFIKVTFACTPGTVTPPDPGVPSYNTQNTVTPFASTAIVSAPTGLITGSGTTGNAAKPQAFSINVPSANTGTLTLTGANKAYNGTVLCTAVSGNQALIVSRDTATNRINRASVEDNGASGDKLVNTMLDTTTATANQIAKASSCTDGPATAKLAAAPAITSGDITINGTPSARKAL